MSRGLSRRASRASLLSLTVVVAGGLLAARFLAPGDRGEVEELADFGLPADLPHHGARLTSLELPIPLERGHWLPSGLRHLQTTGLSREAAAELPRVLQTLIVEGYVSLPSLEPLPRSLRDVTLREGEIGSLAGLPPGVVSLGLGGVSDLDLGALGEVDSLSLTGTRVRDLVGLPARLGALDLTGTDVERLEGAGPGLRTVALRRTLADSLADLPGEIERLVLDGNQLLDPLRMADLPSSLVELQVIGQRLELPAEGAFPLRYLRSLSLRDVRLDRPLDLAALPSTLTELEIHSDALERLDGLPPELRHLGLIGNAPHDLSVLPATVRSLSLEGGVASSLGTVRAPLETLVLHSGDDPSVPAVERVPASLVELELYGVAISGSISWGPNLRTLRYWDGPAPALATLPTSLQVLELNGVWGLTSLDGIERLDQLEELRLRGTEIEKLEKVPASVRSIDVAATGVDDLEKQQWPPEVTELILAQHQLRSLRGLPASVRTLRFEAALAPRAPASPADSAPVTASPADALPVDDGSSG